MAKAHGKNCLRVNRDSISEAKIFNVGTNPRDARAPSTDKRVGAERKEHSFHWNGVQSCGPPVLLVSSHKDRSLSWHRPYLTHSCYFCNTEWKPTQLHECLLHIRWGHLKNSHRLRLVGRFLRWSKIPAPSAGAPGEPLS